jgi:hypothetical protein
LHIAAFFFPGKFRFSFVIADRWFFLYVSVSLVHCHTRTHIIYAHNGFSLNIIIDMLRNLAFNAELADMEQHFFDHEAHFESEEDVGLKQKHKLIPVPTAVSDNDSGYFECNICLDSAHDPVVTLCGHLYCWPCIYKWLHVKTSSPDATQQQPSCPVCKADISPNSLVPL